MNGTLQSTRSKLNIVSTNSTLVDNITNEWAELTIIAGSDYLLENYNGTLPNISTGADNLLIGEGTVADADRIIAIGQNAQGGSSADDSIAIGTSAVTGTGAVNAIQLATGTNNDTNTLQYQTVTLANNVGLELEDNAGSPDGSVTARQHTLLVDNTNSTDVYINTDGAMAWSLISGGGFKTVVKTLATDTADVGRINLLNGTTTLNLPAGVDDDLVIIADYSQQFHIFPVTIVPNGAETIQGESSLTLSSKNSTVSLVFNGTAWTIWGTEPFVDFTGSGGLPGGVFADDIGDGAATSIVVNHNLGTKDVIVAVYDNNSPFREVIVDVDHTSTNDITLGFTVAPLLDEYRVVVTTGGAQGDSGYTAISVSAGTDVTLTPGVSDNRVFISPTVASINCIVLTAGADNKTFWTIVNDDPGTGSIDVRIDLVGNPIQVTLDAVAPYINVAYDGTDYRFYA